MTRRSLSDQYDFDRVTAALDDVGFAVLPSLLSPEDCAAFASAFDDKGQFRSHIDMRRYGFGEGQYRYFSYPLPPLLQCLRTEFYAALVPVANAWRARMGHADDLPSALSDYTALCHNAGQTRPTPLLLKYGAGDYNRLHQDLYGDLQFPIQVAVLLNQPGDDFDGGEFVLTEQKPRAQSRAHVVPLSRGDAVAFAVNQRPVRGTRGDYRVTLRHGVSTLRRGQRHTLGIIFHDAR